MEQLTPTTSRRAVLRTLTATPVVVTAIQVRTPWDEALAVLHDRYDDRPARLVRTKAGRDLSEARYQRAEEFFPEREGYANSYRDHFLYFAGITAQLGLSSHLLDVGFDDRWCARHIGLRVAKSLAYANATGFGHSCEKMERLAAVLTPYWKWNTPRYRGEPEPDDGGFDADQVRSLLRALLDHVRHVTGHSQPKGLRPSAVL
jgi:hypothetical protein